MSILSGFKKVGKYLKTSKGYSLISQWTSSQTVEMDDGTVLENKMTDVETDLNQKAEINSPTLTGTPKAPTASAETDTAQIATTAFVQNAVRNGVKSGDAYIDAKQSGSVTTITHGDVERTGTTSTVSPANGGTFTAVDSIASDAKGHITSVNTKSVTLPTFQAENITAEGIGALPITGGTLTGDLRIKGNGNFGTRINLGDGDYVHFYEPTDDCLEIKAKKVNFVVSDTGDTGFTLNGAKIGGTCDKAKKVTDSYNGSDVTFAYGNAGLDYGNYTWLAAWNGYELRAVNKNQFAQANHSHNYAAANHTHNYAAASHSHDYTSLSGRYILRTATVSIAAGISAFSGFYASGGSVTVGSFTELAIVSLNGSNLWLTGWSYSGTTLSINVFKSGSSAITATIYYFTR